MALTLRRLRTAGSLTEVHVVSFPSRACYESYVSDEERMSHRRLLDGVEVEQPLLQVHDV